MMKKTVLVLLTLMLLVAGGCYQTDNKKSSGDMKDDKIAAEIPEENDDSEEDDVSESDKAEESGEEAVKMLVELLGISEEKATDIEKAFYLSSGEKMENAELVPTEKKGYLVRVQGHEKVYYMKISSYGRLKEIRSEAPDGKVLYQIIS